MLVEGEVYFDGSVHAFDQLASLFYQVDIVLPSTTSTSTSTSPIQLCNLSPINLSLSKVDGGIASDMTHIDPTPHPTQPQPISPSPSPSPSRSDAVILRISSQCGGLESYERVVQYNPNLMRLTFEKRLVPLTKVWKILGDLKEENVLEKYSFRTMGMEEALATIIASSKGL